MLALAVDPRLLAGGLQPFDLVVLAAVLGRAAELRDAGVKGIIFCEVDEDLLPWRRDGTDKPALRALYDDHAITVEASFT